MITPPHRSPRCWTPPGGNSTNRDTHNPASFFSGTRFSMWILIWPSQETPQAEACATRDMVESRPRTLNFASSFAQGAFVTGTGILIAIACLAAGFAVAWAWASSSGGAARLELEKRAAGLDGTIGELKKLNDALQQDARISQKRIEEEQKLRATAEKDAEAQRSNLAEQKR